MLEQLKRKLQPLACDTTARIAELKEPPPSLEVPNEVPLGR